MSKYISYHQFKDIFFKLQEKSPTYRIGQAFIWMFVAKEDNTIDYDSLWNEWNPNVAEEMILSLIDKLQWNMNSLKVLRNSNLGDITEWLN